MRPKLFLLIFSLLTFSITYSQNNSDGNIRRVVIDAGHGGDDPGAISKDRKYFEKNITLSVALSLGKMIEEAYPDVEVIYTRKTDVFIPLDQRTNIANKNKANLFVSIHVNSARATEAAGTETFVMGIDKSNANLEVSKLENSVVVLEDDYSSKYQGFDPNNPESYIIFSLLQNSHLEQSLNLAETIQESLKSGPIKKSRGIKQAEFLVLWRATMPSVLIEIGFISNFSDYKILIDKEAQKDFAKSIFNAFSKYKEKFNTQKGENTDSVKQPKSESVMIPERQIKQTDQITKKTEKEVKNLNNLNDTTGKMIYMIQLLAVSKEISPNSPELKGVKNPEIVKIGNYYKYFTGKYTNFDEAKSELIKIRKLFPQAFIVTRFNGEIKLAKEK
jgi:N-acetylmuramoyl-L-alanine amidase